MPRFSPYVVRCTPDRLWNRSWQRLRKKYVVAIWLAWENKYLLHQRVK